MSLSFILARPRRRFIPLAKGTLVADGTEQVVVETRTPGRIMGYIDLQEMALGDTVVIRQYIRVRPDGGAFKKYAEESFSGAQAVPIIYIRPKESANNGIRVTLQQTAGVMRSYDFSFLREV
jgi:hypothetical protein